MNVTYDVVEGNGMYTSLQFNVKGETAFPDIVVPGTITAEIDGTASELFVLLKDNGGNLTFFILSGVSDYEEFVPIRFENNADIRFHTRQDLISLEYDDRVILIFTPDDPNLISAAEIEGEYIRNTAIVNIIDDDSKCMEIIQYC